MANVPADLSVGAVRSDPDSASRGVAVWIILGGAIGAVFLGAFTLWLVREQLHIGCGAGQPGTEGDGAWMCADGIGYLWVAVTLGGMTMAVTLVGGLVAGLVRRERVARTLLVLLAAASAGWVLGWTWYGSSELVSAVPPGTRSVDYWFASVFPAAIACVMAIVSALVGLLPRGVSARIFLGVGAVAMLAGTVLQPGLAINTLPAAGLLAAAAVRAPRPPKGVR